MKMSKLVGQRDGKMKIGSLDLRKRWEELSREREENKGFRRTGIDKDRQRTVMYGVRQAATGGFGFFAEDEKGRDLTGDYFDERSEGNVAGFIVELNATRAFRPGGGDRQPGRQREVSTSPEACRFFCCDASNSQSLLIRAIVGTVSPSDVKDLSSSWQVYPNLAPFEPDGQFLIVPAGDDGSLPHEPQHLTESRMRDMIALCVASDELVIFFNSVHAGATVNHFHLQAVHHGDKLPIQKSIPSGPGVTPLADSYPVNGLVFFGADVYPEMWPVVRSLQKRESPFNLIYLDRQFLLVPRDDNNEIVREFPNVLASMEICGRFILSDRESFEAATAGRIATALGRIRLSYDDFKID